MLNRKVGTMSQVTEPLIYSTLKLERNDGGSGTGFLFKDEDKDGGSVPLIITNFHVIDGCQSIKFNTHGVNNGEVSGIHTFEITDINQLSIRHPNKDIDLVAIPVSKILQNALVEGTFFATHIDSSVFVDEELDQLDAVEEVLMVGYPNGLTDEVNNHPLFRRGITATHPLSDFRNQPVGVVDIAAFPGSSGSPIYMHRRANLFTQKLDKSIDTRRQEYIKLLGILFAGPQIDAAGEFEIIEIPNKQMAFGSSRVMMNLGYYVKARELKTLLDLIYEHIGFVPVDVRQGNTVSSAIEASGQTDSTP